MVHNGYICNILVIIYLLIKVNEKWFYLEIQKIYRTIIFIS